jgi:hypothetical protein
MQVRGDMTDLQPPRYRDYQPRDTTEDKPKYKKYGPDDGPEDLEGQHRYREDGTSYDSHDSEGGHAPE